MKTCTCKPSPFGDSLIRKSDGYYCPKCGGMPAATDKDLLKLCKATQDGVMKEALSKPPTKPIEKKPICRCDCDYVDCEIHGVKTSEPMEPISSYVRNCEITLRKTDNSLFVQTKYGVFARLDGYRITPIEPPDPEPTSITSAELLNTIDANIWAKEFIRLYEMHIDWVDLDLMRAWFANAIMAGYDKGKRGIKPDPEPIPDIPDEIVEIEQSNPSPKSLEDVYRMYHEPIEAGTIQERQMYKILNAIRSWLIENLPAEKEILGEYCVGYNSCLDEIKSIFNKGKI